MYYLLSDGHCVFVTNYVDILRIRRTVETNTLNDGLNIDSTGLPIMQSRQSLTACSGRLNGDRAVRQTDALQIIRIRMLK